MRRVASKTVVKRTKDEALEHIKLALRTNGNPFTKQEMSFIRTSCHILGVDGNTVAKAIMSELKDKGVKQPKKVMEFLQSQLKELADRVEKHKRPTPNPATSTRAVDSMGAPARSLGNLLGCAEALKEATKGQYSKGIKAAIKAMEDAKSDYKATIDRVAEASRWKEEITNDWVGKGELACGNLLEKAEEVLKEAEEREEAEAKIRIMEGQCEELADLVAQAGKQVPAEAEVEVLEELEEEMDQREEMVSDLGRALKETVPEGLKGRVEEAMRESVAIATRGRRYVDHVKTQLDFSKDSESGSSKVAVGAATGGWQTAAEELGEVLTESSESDDEPEEDGAKKATEVAPPRPAGLHEGFRAHAGQRQWVAYIRWTIRQLPSVQERVEGLSRDLPLRGEQRPGRQSPQRQVSQGRCPSDGEPPRQPAGDMGDP
jgi:hypothetical protein